MASKTYAGCNQAALVACRAILHGPRHPDSLVTRLSDALSLARMVLKGIGMDRRVVLKGLGGALALPLLEAGTLAEQASLAAADRRQPARHAP